jgi:amino acid transporter
MTMKLRQYTAIAAIVLGALMIIGGAGTWLLVSNTLADQAITVSDDGCLPGEEVDGPFTAYCQAKVIEKHTLERTEGKTYAQLDREDPLRETAMNSSFLQASLFTSVLSFGVSAMAAAVGILFVLIGLGIRDVSTRSGTTSYDTAGV